MSAKPRINVVLMDNYTSKELPNFLLEEKHFKIYTSGATQNVNTDLEKIEKHLGHKVHPLVLDFFLIALTVYISDVQFKRTRITEGRNFRILVSVSNVDRWNSVREKLQATLVTLTGDNYTFNFIQREQPAQFTFQKKEERVVSLFSGGLDSLSGVKWLLDKGIEPIMVSHCSSPHICKTQTTLKDKLIKITGKNLSFFQIGAKAKKGTESTQKESSQLSRSFLYLALGTMFALEMGIEKIYLFENGVLAMNVPISESRIYRNTRTAHPGFLIKFNSLIQSIFVNQISVENPFNMSTKSEAVKTLDADQYRDLVRDSISCSEIRRLITSGVKLSTTKHCGKCLPCILRRVSVHAAGLWNYDATYASDVLGEFSAIPDDGKKLLFEILDFCRRLENISEDSEVLIDFPYFYVDESVDPFTIIGMYRRYVKEITNCLQDKGALTLKQNLHI